MGSSPSILNEPLDLIDKAQQHVYLCNQAWKALEMGILYKCNGIAYTGLASWLAHIDEMKSYGLDNIPKFYSDLIIQSYQYKELAPEFDKYYMYFKRRHMEDEKKDAKNDWLPDTIKDGIGKTGSITLDMAVICYLMGYKKIYLIGMDLDYTAPNGYFFEATSLNYKVSGPTANNGIRRGIHNRMCRMSEVMAKKGVELINISRGYKPEQYTDSLTVPVDRLENVLEGVVKPKAIGCIHNDFSSLSKTHIDQITVARRMCDKLVVSCLDENASTIMSALRNVDQTVIAHSAESSVKILREMYPSDNIRLFHSDGKYTVYNESLL
jgi:hypothetical protein